MNVGHPSEVDEIFDAISYSKGASVIRMLHDYIGDQVDHPSPPHLSVATPTSMLLHFLWFTLLPFVSHASSVFCCRILGKE